MQYDCTCTTSLPAFYNHCCTSLLGSRGIPRTLVSDIFRITSQKRTRFVYLLRRNIPEFKEGTVNYSLQPHVVNTVDTTLMGLQIYIL